jgi:hypothetical protein
VRRKLYLAIVSTLNAASAVVPLRRHQESGAGSIPGLRGGGAYDARRIADGDKIPVVIFAIAKFRSGRGVNRDAEWFYLIAGPCQ